MTVQEAIDHVGFGRFQRRLLLVCGVTWAADAAEILLIAFALPAISAEFEVSRAAGGLLVTATFLGMLAGAWFWGMTSDRIGRRTGFQLTVLIFAVFGALSALAPTFATLVVLRALTGFGLGGALPLDFSLYAEYLPARSWPQSRAAGELLGAGDDRGRWLGGAADPDRRLAAAAGVVGAGRGAGAVDPQADPRVAAVPGHRRPHGGSRRRAGADRRGQRSHAAARSAVGADGWTAGGADNAVGQAVPAGHRDAVGGLVRHLPRLLRRVHLAAQRLRRPRVHVPEHVPEHRPARRGAGPRLPVGSVAGRALGSAANARRLPDGQRRVHLPVRRRPARSGSSPPGRS